MNIAALKATIYGWAAGATASKVYWDNPAAPRPASPAVRLKLIAGPTMLGLDEFISVPGSATAFNQIGPRALTLSVNTYGPTAQQVASDLQSSLSDPATMETLAAGNVSSLGTSGLRDISAMLDTQFEQRCQFDVDLLSTELVTLNPGVIQHVAGMGSLLDESSNTETIVITADAILDIISGGAVAAVADLIYGGNAVASSANVYYGGTAAEL